MSVCCDCCVLSGRASCDERINRLEECYRLWCVVVCNLETPKIRRPWTALGRRFLISLLLSIIVDTIIANSTDDLSQPISSY
jgi:hypothetical protein